MHVSSDGLEMLGFRRSLQVPGLATPFHCSNVAMIVTAIVGESIHRITLASAFQKGDADDSFVVNHSDLRRFAFSATYWSDTIAVGGLHRNTRHLEWPRDGGAKSMLDSACLSLSAVRRDTAPQ